jgi:hypothetical protein
MSTDAPSPAAERERPRAEQTISHDAFVATAREHGVPTDKADAIWADLARSPAAAARGVGLRREPGRLSETTRLSRAVKVLLYLGAFVVVGSYGWWATSLEFGAGGLLVLSLVYGAGFLAVAIAARRRGLEELVAAAATILAFYVPVCAYAVLRLAGFEFRYEEDEVAGFYRWIDGGWVWMELAAIGGAAVLLRAFRTPLLMLPLSLFTLFFAMDAAVRVSGVDPYDSDAVEGFVLAFGTLAIAAGTVLDLLGFRRHALWPHTFGAIGFVSGLGFLLSGSSIELAVVSAGGAFVLAGVWLGRVGYLIAGGLCLWAGITALSPTPLILTLSGLGLVAVAIWLSLAQSPLRAWLHNRPLPTPQRD